MRVPARVFASEKMLNQVMSDKALLQLVNVTTLPGIQSHACVMPDVHEGYGFPIGAVAAIDYQTGAISPGGIGYDINCGVRLLLTDLTFDEIRSRIPVLAKELYRQVPSGVGKGGPLRLGHKELDKVLNYGLKWAETEGYAHQGDSETIESAGYLKMADARYVSDIAKDRGSDQLGTMGAGNHFVEIDKVSHIFDIDAARAYGLSENQIVVQIHTGSRGLGHQVATDYIRLMLSKLNDFGFTLPDRELSCAPVNSEAGRNYLSAMSAAANFAWVNRQMITWEIRQAFANIFGQEGSHLRILYDVAHNIAKLEKHKIGGIEKDVIVHRKGATRAFPAGHPEIPAQYRSVGQPVLIPGSMGTASYVLRGLTGSMELSFGSTCHGAGRTMSRTKAKKQIESGGLLKELNSHGIEICTGSLKSLPEEAPQAYKDIDSVVDVVHNAGIAGKVARLKPLAVIKG